MLLRELVDELDLLVTFGYRPTKVMKYGMEGVRRMRSARERKDRRDAMRRLCKQQLIVTEKIGKDLAVTLSEKGAMEYFRVRVCDSPFLPIGRVCMIVFDIPETERSKRKMFRDFLRYSGFHRLQQSVWVCHYDVFDAMQKILQIRGLAKWVSMYESERINLNVT